MFIIKIGGSVITKKYKKATFRKEIMDNLAIQLKKANKDYILVHGAGSYGHILAKKYNIINGFQDNNQLHGFSITHSLVQKLNTMVLDSLHENGINAVSIPPHATIMLNNHELFNMKFDIYKNYIKNCFIPLTFGDVVLDEKLGFSICSGDLLILALSKYFKPEKTIFIIDEDGLYTSNPKKNNDAKFIEKGTVDDLTNLQTLLDNHDDVTKGMEGKINTIKNIAYSGFDTVLLNGNKPERLYDVLIGKKTKNTIVYGCKQ
jgi:isopentenyl phosphate kinase